MTLLTDFNCDSCGKSFTQASSLRRHIKIFTKVTTILNLVGNLVENQFLKLLILLQILFIERIVWILLKILHPSFSWSHVNLVANLFLKQKVISLMIKRWWKCSRRTFYIICLPSTYLLLLNVNAYHLWTFCYLWG